MDVAFIVVGAGIALFAGYSLIVGARSEHWPRAIGTIVSSAVSEQTDNKGVTMYTAEIRYRYSVHGQELIGDNVKFGGQLSLDASSRAANVVAKYPVGATVPVSYDPDRPSRAVLEPGKNPLAWFGIVFGMIFLVVGALLLSA